MGLTGRSKGHRISASQRIALGVRLREELMKDSTLSIEELVRRTGAPYDMSNFIRKRFKQEREKAENDAKAAKEEAGHARDEELEAGGLSRFVPDYA